MPKKSVARATQDPQSKASTKKTVISSKSAQSNSKKPRRVKQSSYQSMKLSKRIKHHVKLPSAWKITKSAALLVWHHRRLFIGITLLYGILNLILVKGFSGGADIGSLKHELSQLFRGNFGTLGSSLTIFLYLVTTSGNSSSSTGGAYQLLLVLVMSLAIIWLFRQILAGSTALRVRDSLYRGMYPLVPFILVLAVIAIQTVPLIIGSTLYTLVITYGIAALPAERLVWALFFAILALLSIYMICSSIFALYIVTLPDMTPMKALRSARELVRFRRWTVMRKVLILPVILVLAAVLIMVPVIIWLTPLSQWVFFLLTMFSLVAVHGYMYTLYRELLRE